MSFIRSQKLCGCLVRVGRSNMYLCASFSKLLPLQAARGHVSREALRGVAVKQGLELDTWVILDTGKVVLDLWKCFILPGLSVLGKKQTVQNIPSLTFHRCLKFTSRFFLCPCLALLPSLSTIPALVLLFCFFSRENQQLSYCAAVVSFVSKAFPP